MGRPIKASHFGTPKGTGVGGEGVASVGSITAGTGYYSANAVVVFGSPGIAGGVTATGVPVLNGSGNVTAVTITLAGSGYLSAPSVVFSGANASPAFGTAALTSSVDNAIKATAFLLVADGGSSGVDSDIIKQVGSRRYKVQNAQGSGKVTLVTTAPGAGEMRITATDSAAGTYYVKKLESRTASLVPGTGTQFVLDQHVTWTLGTAIINESVQLANQ